MCIQGLGGGKSAMRSDGLTMTLGLAGLGLAVFSFAHLLIFLAENRYLKSGMFLIIVPVFARNPHVAQNSN